MMVKQPYVPRQLTGPQWFGFLTFMGLLTRIPMLRVFSAETTDGVLCLTYFSPDFVQTPRFILSPGYPALLWLGQQLALPGWLWGRILSALAGLLFLIPLWKLARRWVSMEMAGVICLMALFSPLLWFWSLRVMPDTLFLLFFWWSLERLTAVYIDRNPAAWWHACVAGALAALTRPEGFILLPWILALDSRLPREGVWKKIAGLAVLWTVPFGFISLNFLTLLYSYREGLGLTHGMEVVRIPFLNFIDHLYAYLSQPLYVFTPLVVWFAVLGLAKMARREGVEGEAFRKILAQIFILVFLSRLIPTTYQDRHMLPFLPLLVLAAGYQLEVFFESLERYKGTVRLVFWKNGLLALCLAWLALFSSATLMAQHDSFGDIKRSSDFLKKLPPDKVIYSDEVPKTQYWSGRKVVLMPYLYENTQFVPKAGDIVVLHSFYIPRIADVDRHLTVKHDAHLLFEDYSWVMPLLTDVMENQELQNRTASTAFRFKTQFFRSRVYEIRR